jgi:hypothetical protein
VDIEIGIVENNRKKSINDIDKNNRYRTRPITLCSSVTYLTQNAHRTVLPQLITTGNWVVDYCAQAPEKLGQLTNICLLMKQQTLVKLEIAHL